ncbi:MAG: glycosyltransferase family 4 protein, partial [Fibrobacterota bacterium]
MKILMYGWEFPPHISGGLGTACYGLTRALADLGHQITFVLPRISASGNQESHVTLVSSDQVEIESGSLLENITSQDRINIEALPSTLQPYVNDAEYRKLLAHLQIIKSEMAETRQASKISMAGDYGANLMEEIARYARVAGAIAGKVGHEVIHAHDWMTIPAGLEAKRVSGRPLVLHVHSLEFDRCGDNVNPDVYAIERKGMEKADKIVAVSQFTKNKITRHYGIHPDKIRVVHNGVMKAASGEGLPVRRGVPKKTVLFLGRITFQKGPDYFVEAAARVISVYKDVCFVMSGCGDMMHRMIERVAELKIGRYFHFTGFLRGQDVARIYRMSDLYVMP